LKYTYLKSQAAAVTGSVADYATTILLVEFFHIQYVLSSFFGNVMGGTLLFLLNRRWVFKAESGNIHGQMVKFLLVFAGNIILSAAGIYLLTKCLHLNYLISKTLISVFLGLTYNFFMQKKIVFSLK
jgi:putative flippase GtrA